MPAQVGCCKKALSQDFLNLNGCFILSKKVGNGFQFQTQTLPFDEENGSIAQITPEDGNEALKQVNRTRVCFEHSKSS